VGVTVTQGWVAALTDFGGVGLEEPVFRLIKQALPLTPATTKAELDAVECDFPGYAAVTLGEFATGWTAPEGQADGGARTISLENAVFTRNAGGDAQTIFGWYLVPEGTGPVLAFGLFAVPIPTAGAGDGVIVIPMVSWPNQGDPVYQST
jgi:hypothetical protein